MNPMHHLVDRGNENRSKHWWIRLGTKDSDTALTVASNLADRVKNLGDDVDTSYDWDVGHGADNDRPTSSSGSLRCPAAGPSLEAWVVASSHCSWPVM